MEAIIASGVALLAQVVPTISGSAAVGTAIKFVTELLPPAIQLAKGEVPVIKGIIATLRSNGSTTVDQMNDLDALDAQCDAVLDAAIAKAEAEDAS